MIYTKLMLGKLKTKLGNFSTPFIENMQPCKTKDIIIGIMVFLVAFAAFASLSTEALINGDTAVYLQQMKNLNFSNRSVHIGYYLLGAGFIHILPGSDDRAINLMNCFLGALSIMLLYLITFIICHRHLVALISGLFLLTHYIFLENSIYAEVYTPQICFLLLSLLWWLLDRPFVAGLSFAIGFLITPSTVFALPLFFILRPRLRPLVLFCATILAIAVAAIFPVYRDYFFGGRGLLKAAHAPVDISQALRKEGGEIFFSLFLCILFVLIGLIEIFRQKRFRPLGIALLALWIANLLFGEKFSDVPVQLPTYVLLCLVGGLGFHLLLRISNNKPYGTILSGIILASLMITVILIKTKKTPAQVSAFLPTWFLVMIVACMVLCILVTVLTKFRRIQAQVGIISAVIFVIATNGFIAFAKMKVMSNYHTGYRNTIIEIGRAVGPDHLIIADFSRAKLFEHYLSPRPLPSYLNINALMGKAGKEHQLETVRKLDEALAARRQIWVLGNYSGLLRGLQQSGYKIDRFGYVYVAMARN